MMSEAALPKIQNAADLEAALLRAGFSYRAGELAQMARPSVQFDTNTADYIRAGASRLGGLPDLPYDVDWPFRPPILHRSSATDPDATLRWSASEIKFLATRQPLSFVGQANLKDIAQAVDEDLGLPRDGMLYFFYDDLYEGWGFDPKDAPGFKVIYHSSTVGLAARKQPLSLTGLRRFDPVELIPTRGFDPLPAWGFYFDQLGFDLETKNRYYDLLLEFDATYRFSEIDFESGHKMRGWADQVQNAMEGECALVTAGINVGGPEGYQSPEAQRILDEPNDWTLLWQIGYEDTMMWGDFGILYVWIRASDLAQKNFDRVWVILQSS